jgi:hypothetical protein
MLAIGAVFMLEMLDRRVRAPEDIIQTLGLPLIGVMPGPAPRKRLFGKPNLHQDAAQRLLGSMNAAGKNA